MMGNTGKGEQRGHSVPWLPQMPPAGIPRKRPVGLGHLHSSMEALVEGMPGAVTRKQPLRTWPSLRATVSSGSLSQGPKCQWAEQPPKENLLQGGTDSPIGHHTPLYPWRGKRLENLSVDHQGVACKRAHPVQELLVLCRRVVV